MSVVETKRKSGNREVAASSGMLLYSLLLRNRRLTPVVYLQQLYLSKDQQPTFGFLPLHSAERYLFHQQQQQQLRQITVPSVALAVVAAGHTKNPGHQSGRASCPLGSRVVGPSYLPPAQALPPPVVWSCRSRMRESSRDANGLVVEREVGYTQLCTGPMFPPPPSPNPSPQFDSYKERRSSRRWPSHLPSQRRARYSSPLSLFLDCVRVTYRTDLTQGGDKIAADVTYLCPVVVPPSPIVPKSWRRRHITFRLSPPLAPPATPVPW